MPECRNEALKLPHDLAHRLEALGAALLFGLFRLLPLDAASALGGWLGRSIGPRLGVTKRAAINLRRALPELDAAAARRVMRGMWDNLGRVVAEYPHLAEFRVYGDDGRIAFVGDDILDPVIASGKSAIFISAHYGNWEIATMAATQRGLDVAEIYRAANNPWIDRLIASYRDSVGSELIPKGTIAARRSIAALRDGRHLAMLVDQKMNDGIPVPFFGRDAMTAPAIAQFAVRLGCVLVPARTERLKGARFRITVYPPLELPATGERTADEHAIMVTINRIIEDWIRDRPEQWLWLHRRWPD